MTLLDTRARETYRELERRCDFKKIYRETGCTATPLYPLPKMFWLRKKRPRLFNRARYFCGAKDYIGFRLTGEFATEASLSSATQMFDIRRCEWNPYALGFAGVGPHNLPRVVESAAPLGGLTGAAASRMGLRSGVVVVPGVYDAAALILGIGGLEAGVGAVNLGTTAMLRAVVREPKFDRYGERLQTYCFDRTRWLAGAGINNAGGVLTWLANQFGLKSEARVEALARRVPRGAEGLFFLPYLTGERDPRIGGSAAGAMVGFRGHHNINHVALAAIEGVCYTIRLVRDALAENGVGLREIRAGGGGTRSRLWVQMLADMLKVPVRVSGVGGAAHVGSAMLGFVALRRFSRIEDAAKRMVRPGRLVRPVARHVELYDRGIRSYLDLIGRLFG